MSVTAAAVLTAYTTLELLLFGREQMLHKCWRFREKMKRENEKKKKKGPLAQICTHKRVTLARAVLSLVRTHSLLEISLRFNSMESASKPSPLVVQTLRHGK